MQNVLYYLYCNERKVSDMGLIVAVVAIAIIAAVVVAAVTAVLGGVIGGELDTDDE